MSELQAKEASSPQEKSKMLPKPFSLQSGRTLRSTLWQLLRYCLVGGINTGLDLLVLNVLLWRFPTHNVQVLVIYNSLAYVSGAISSFCLNKYWTFEHKHNVTGRELRRYFISILLELVYSNILVWLIGKALQPFIANPTLWGNATKLLALSSGVIISYSLMRFWTFAKDPQARATAKNVDTLPPVESVDIIQAAEQETEQSRSHKDEQTSKP